MKIKKVKSLIQSGIVIGMAGFIFIVIAACKDKIVPQPPTEYQSLVKTRWKCLGFYDSETSEFSKFVRWEDIVPNSSDTIQSFQYVLKFTSDSTLWGRSFGNDVQGHFIINYSLKAFEFIHPTDPNATGFSTLTYAGEGYEFYPNGETYIQLMNKVQHFSFIDEELKLFYNDKKNYLLFERIYYKLDMEDLWY